MTKRVIFAGLLAGILAGCSERDTPASSSQPSVERRDSSPAPPQAPRDTPAFDACKLLSNEEIASIQGEAPATTQLVGESDGQLSVSQCNFLLPTGTSSLSVRVVERGNGPAPRDPKQVWQETFRRPPPDAATLGEARKFQKVDAVGEDAFWLGDLKSGGLHVLQGNRYIRISLGGQDDLPTKITKCSKLSEFVLSRLHAEK
jgi:hypothetical protein